MLALLLWGQGASACALDQAQRRGVVQRVFDGDTLALTDATRVRVLGVDAPETRHNDRPAQPYATQARDALARLAPPGAAVHLRLDARRTDPYGRLLAHVYVQDGRSAGAELLRAGLATTLTLPPNTWQAACLSGLEAGARRARRGIWSLPAYQPMPAARVPLHRHYRVLTGRVSARREDRHGITLVLDERIEVWLVRAVLAKLPPALRGAGPGAGLTVRGMLEVSGPRPHLVVRYPGTVELGAAARPSGRPATRPANAGVLP